MPASKKQKKEVEEVTCPVCPYQGGDHTCPCLERINEIEVVKKETTAAYNNLAGEVRELRSTLDKMVGGNKVLMWILAVATSGIIAICVFDLIHIVGGGG